MKRRTNIWLLAAVAAGALLAQAADVKFTLPKETAKLKDAPEVQLANTHCLICHSADYISTQPKLNRAGWAASVKKMREKYGAIIAEDKVEPLVSYLVANYGKPDEAK